ncbi:MAG: hypothetical protein KDC67_10560 [Ignavibacteriae bacterium]|nr:hypothetical protein [Ignavibacteriota bacterium]
MNFITQNKNSMYFKSKRLKKDMFILFFIIALPFAFFIYNIAPEEIHVWKTSWFEIDSGYHKGVDYFLWILSVKFLTLSILSIWFVTCIHKWRMVILAPIFVEIYKICVNISITHHGLNYDFYFPKSLLISIPFSILLIFVSKKIGYYSRFNTQSLNEEISDSMIKISKFDSSIYKNIKKELNKLNKEKEAMDKKDYLIKLIALRDKMTI